MSDGCTGPSVFMGVNSRNGYSWAPVVMSDGFVKTVEHKNDLIKPLELRLSSRGHPKHYFSFISDKIHRFCIYTNFIYNHTFTFTITFTNINSHSITSTHIHKHIATSHIVQHPSHIVQHRSHNIVIVRHSPSL